jgi:hypothetical protein
MCCPTAASPLPPRRLQSIGGGPFLRHVTVEQAVSEPPSSIPAATSSSTALTSRCSPATSLTYPTSSLACRRCSPTAHSRRHGTNLFGGLPLSPTPLPLKWTPHLTTYLLDPPLPPHHRGWPKSADAAAVAMIPLSPDPFLAMGHQPMGGQPVGLGPANVGLG